MHDLFLAFRRLLARPVFAFTATLVLALGIGATTAAFTLVSAVLLEPLPYPQPDRLVRIWKNDVERGFDGYPIVYPEYELWREASASFDEAALMWRLPWCSLRSASTA